MKSGTRTMEHFETEDVLRYDDSFHEQIVNVIPDGTRNRRINEC